MLVSRFALALVACVIEDREQLPCGVVGVLIHRFECTALTYIIVDFHNSVKVIVKIFDRKPISIGERFEFAVVRVVGIRRELTVAHVDIRGVSEHVISERIGCRLGGLSKNQRNAKNNLCVPSFVRN